MDWHWKNQVCSFLGNTTSPMASFPRLPTALCVGFKPLGLCPFHFGMVMAVDLIQLRCGHSWRWDFLGVAFDVSRRQKSCNRLLDTLALIILLPPLQQCSLSPRCRTQVSLHPQISVAFTLIRETSCHRQEKLRKTTTNRSAELWRPVPTAFERLKY